MPRITKRGVLWVLQWSAAIAVLASAASMLTEFACLLAAEHSLNLAARAGVSEAMLPRATAESVRAAVERRLAGYSEIVHELKLTILQNGSPVQRQIRRSDGDRFSIFVSVPNSAVIPKWATVFQFWPSEPRIQAHAERRMPSRTLAFGAGLPTSPKE